MKKHIKVAAALLFKDGKIFATKRGDSPYSYVAHKYEFPGGKIEEGERGEDAVKRELREELDLDVSVGGLYACHTFEYPDFIITLSVYECVALSDFVLKEHESYAWVAPKDLKAEEWAPADADILESLKRVFGE
ncbi:MAG: (deoxy)nucleoside triphosphate pyrophosphohydrolase [Clostridia bacterium]|nr:(deoxy)nucleoside triphosphate pyrophosphohydrolase [Clostridia bacterium]